MTFHMSHICDLFHLCGALMCLQFSCIWKFLSTKLTFMIFLTIMNCSNVYLQIEKIIFHMNHICDLLDHYYELLLYVATSLLQRKMPFHKSHICDLFWPLWTVVMCIFNPSACKEDFSQDSHWWCFLHLLSWTIFMCLLNWYGILENFLANITLMLFY